MLVVHALQALCFDQVPLLDVHVHAYGDGDLSEI